MNVDLCSDGNPCAEKVPEIMSTLRDGENEMSIASELLCCVCRQLLDDPMLLSCLHNCCRRCLSYSSRPIHEPSEAQPASSENSGTFEIFGASYVPSAVYQHPLQSNTSSVCCQICTEITGLGTAVENVYLAGKMKALRVHRNAEPCAFCSDDVDAGSRKASFWCGSCRSPLCAECVTGHRKFYKTHSTISLHEHGEKVVGSSTTSAVSCVKHSRPFELACFTCTTAKCLSCAADCIATRHELLLMSDPRFASRFAQLKLKVVELTSSVKSKTSVLQQHVDLAERLSAAREADLSQLKANKRLVVDAVDQAYQEAEAALKDGYDDLEAKALKLRLTAERQIGRVRTAVDYCEQLIAAENEVVALMQQQKVVLSNLLAIVQELDKAPLTRDAFTFFEVPQYTESVAAKFVSLCLPKLQLKAGGLFVDPFGANPFNVTPLSHVPIVPMTWPSLPSPPTPQTKVLSPPAPSRPLAKNWFAVISDSANAQAVPYSSTPPLP